MLEGPTYEKHTSRVAKRSGNVQLTPTTVKEDLLIGVKKISLCGQSKKNHCTDRVTFTPLRMKFETLFR